MPTRTDFTERDANRPRANRWAPAVSCVLWWKGQIILQQRKDTEKWSLPGGTMEFGEGIHDTAIREIFEETGLIVTEIKRLVGIYSDPSHVIAYADGEIRQEFAVVIEAEAQGEWRINDQESLQIQAIDPGNIADVPMDTRHHQRLMDALHYQMAVIWNHSQPWIPLRENTDDQT